MKLDTPKDSEKPNTGGLSEKMKKMAGKFAPKKISKMFLGKETNKAEPITSKVNIELYTKVGLDTRPKLRKGDGAANVAAKLYSILKNSIAEKKLTKNFDETKAKTEKRRQEEILEALEAGADKSGETGESDEEIASSGAKELILGLGLGALIMAGSAGAAPAPAPPTAPPPAAAESSVPVASTSPPPVTSPDDRGEQQRQLAEETRRREKAQKEQDDLEKQSALLEERIRLKAEQEKERKAKAEADRKLREEKAAADKVAPALDMNKKKDSAVPDLVAVFDMQSRSQKLVSPADIEKEKGRYLRVKPDDEAKRIRKEQEEAAAKAEEDKRKKAEAEVKAAAKAEEDKRKKAEVDRIAAEKAAKKEKEKEEKRTAVPVPAPVPAPAPISARPVLSPPNNRVPPQSAERVESSGVLKSAKNKISKGESASVPYLGANQAGGDKYVYSDEESDERILTNIIKKGEGDISDPGSKLKKIKGKLVWEKRVNFEKDLTDMTIREVNDLQKRRSKYFNARGAGSAMGKYQFMPDTLLAQAKEVFGPNYMDTVFSEDVQELLMNKHMIDNAIRLGSKTSELTLRLAHFNGPKFARAVKKAFDEGEDDKFLKDFLTPSEITANKHLVYNNGNVNTPKTIGEYKNELKYLSTTPIPLKSLKDLSEQETKDRGDKIIIQQPPRRSSSLNSENILNGLALKQISSLNMDQKKVNKMQPIVLVNNSTNIIGSNKRETISIPTDPDHNVYYPYAA